MKLEFVTENMTLVFGLVKEMQLDDRVANGVTSSSLKHFNAINQIMVPKCLGLPTVKQVPYCLCYYNGGILTLRNGDCLRKASDPAGVCVAGWDVVFLPA